MTFSPVCLVCDHFDVNNFNCPTLVKAAASCNKVVAAASNSINCDTLSCRVLYMVFQEEWYVF
jgi:hypothetical protein